MGTSQDTIHYICNQAGFGSWLTFRKMFGEFALYPDGKVVALDCDDPEQLHTALETTAQALPESKPRSKAKPKTKRRAHGKAI